MAQPTQGVVLHQFGIRVSLQLVERIRQHWQVRRANEAHGELPLFALKTNQLVVFLTLADLLAQGAEAGHDLRELEGCTAAQQISLQHQLFLLQRVTVNIRWWHELARRALTVFDFRNVEIDVITLTGQR